jgi:hypothetical protein
VQEVGYGPRALVFRGSALEGGACHAGPDSPWTSVLGLIVWKRVPEDERPQVGAVVVKRKHS